MKIRWPFVIGTSLLILNEIRGIVIAAPLLWAMWR